MCFLAIQLSETPFDTERDRRPRQSSGRAALNCLSPRTRRFYDPKCARTAREEEKSKMARRTTNRKQQGNVVKQAWEWADHTEPENITRENVESAYRVNTTGCSQGSCR